MFFVIKPTGILIAVSIFRVNKDAAVSRTLAKFVVFAGQMQESTIFKYGLILLFIIVRSR